MRPSTVKFNLQTIYKGHHQVTYRGIPTWMNPFDYLLYQMLLEEVKPDLVIEIGSHEGGSAYYIADLLELSGKGKIHSIDIEDKTHEVVKRHPRIDLFYEGWENYDLKLTKGFETILVIDDGSHLYEDTLGCLEKFAPVVSPGSYLIVEDGILSNLKLDTNTSWLRNKIRTRKHYKGGPLKAIDKFLKKCPEFSIEERWCDFFGKNATFNVNGYLKKAST